MAYSEDYLLSQMLITATGCWEWQGRIGTHGYGVLPDHSLAHRTAHEVFIGPIPTWKIVCHSCDYRPCCNPEHLFLGTHGDNTQDAFQKGRMHNPPLKLSDDDVRAIRELIDQGVNQYEIARRFNIRQPMVSRIKSGLRRSTVTQSTTET